MQPHTFCSYCGVKHTYEMWPRTCGACGQTTFRNPVPVTVLLLPVGDKGLLTVRRSNPPHIGELALPGGFLEFGETWQEGAARELREETGIHISPTDVRVFELASATNGNLLLFCRASGIKELPAFTPNEEVSEIVVITEPVPLAFPTHMQMARKFWGL